MTRDGDTARLAGRHQGLLTTNQALAVGWSSSALDRAVRSGRFDRPEPNVLRIGGAPTTWRQRVLACCLTEAGHASHRTAAALWRLEGFEPRIVEVTVRRWQRRPN